MYIDNLSKVMERTIKILANMTNQAFGELDETKRGACVLATHWKPAFARMPSGALGDS